MQPSRVCEYILAMLSFCSPLHSRLDNVTEAAISNDEWHSNEGILTQGGRWSDLCALVFLRKSNRVQAGGRVH
jgi:hypothetical protein